MRSSSSICSVLCRPVRAPAHGARLGIRRDGVRVVLSLVVTVAEVRQRSDRERRERPVDRAIHLDGREIALGSFVEVLRRALCVGEVEVGLGNLQAPGAVLGGVALEELLAGFDGIHRRGGDEVGRGVLRRNDDAIDAGVRGRLRGCVAQTASVCA
jgi:hypothetical protein